MVQRRTSKKVRHQRHRRHAPPESKLNRQTPAGRCVHCGVIVRGQQQRLASKMLRVWSSVSIDVKAIDRRHVPSTLVDPTYRPILWALSRTWTCSFVSRRLAPSFIRGNPSETHPVPLSSICRIRRMHMSSCTACHSQCIDLKALCTIDSLHALLWIRLVFGLTAAKSHMSRSARSTKSTASWPSSFRSAKPRCGCPWASS